MRIKPLKAQKENMDDEDQPVEKLLMDSHLADLLHAYKDCSNVYNAAEDLDVRKQIHGIQILISITLGNLVDMGVHSRNRFQVLEREYKIW